MTIAIQEDGDRKALDVFILDFLTKVQVGFIRVKVCDLSTRLVMKYT